jgi:hypothetical protein
VSIHTVGRQTRNGTKYVLNEICWSMLDLGGLTHFRLAHHRNDYIYICRKRMEDVARCREPMTQSNEENVAHSDPPKSEAPVTG